MIVMYGLSNCDVVRKAMAWMRKNNIEFKFYDLRKDGIPADDLKNWIEKRGLEAVVNKKSTTWRELDPAEQSSFATRTGAIQLISEYPAIIKRPVIEHNNRVLIGFDEKEFKELINN